MFYILKNVNIYLKKKCNLKIDLMNNLMFKLFIFA